MAARTALADLVPRHLGAAGGEIRPLLEQARELAGAIYLERAVASNALLLVLLCEDHELCCSLEALGLDFARLEAPLLALRKPPSRLEDLLQLVESAEQTDLSRIWTIREAAVTFRFPSRTTSRPSSGATRGLPAFGRRKRRPRAPSSPPAAAWLRRPDPHYTYDLSRGIIMFCLSRNWNLPSRELAAILSRRITHASSAPALYP